MSKLFLRYIYMSINYQKYLKYKIKYLELKKMRGGYTFEDILKGDKKTMLKSVKDYMTQVEKNIKTSDIDSKEQKEIITKEYNTYLDLVLSNIRKDIPLEVIQYLTSKSTIYKHIVDFIKLFDDKYTEKKTMISEVTEYLNKLGAKKDDILNEDNMVLRIALLKRIPVKVIKLLITDKTKDIKFVETRQIAPLSVVKENIQCNILKFALIYYQDRDLITLLTSDFKNLKDMRDMTDNDGLTPLYFAVKEDDFSYDYLKLLITEKNKDIQNKHGETPLHIALVNKSLDERIELLISEKNKDIQDSNGYTPLISALILKSSYDIINLLITEKNKDIPDKYGRTPLIYAIEKNFTVGLIKLLITEKNKDIQDSYSQTPLMYALQNNLSVGLIKLLITEKNKDIQDRMGCTPLLYATQKKFTEEIIKLLITEKNKDIQDSYYSQTPLMYALQNNLSVGLIKLLITEKNKDIQDKMGNTPLKYATEKKLSEEIIKLLK